MSDRQQKYIEAIERALHQAQDALIDLKRLQAGENPVRDAMFQWQELWSNRYAKPYVWAARGRDAGSIKRLVNITGSVSVLVEMMRRYIADDEQFLVRQQHPFQIFANNPNRWAPTPPTFRAMEDDAPPPSCHHDPPCRSDAEHTRKRMADLRA